MTDVAYKTTWQHDIYLIEMGIPGPAGTGFTASEATDVRNRLTAVEGRANISTLESLTNVPDSGATAGQTIIRSGSTWVFGNPNSSLTAVTDGTTSVPNVTTVTTAPGIAVTQQAAGNARLAVQFGTSGTATTVARSDHSHSTPVVVNQSIPYQGVLSTGSKIVENTGLAGMDAAIVYDIEYTLHLDVIATGVDSILGPRVRIGPSPATYQGFDVRFKGYGKVMTVTGYALGITGVTNYPLEARVYFNGGPQVELGAGWVLAVASPRR